MRITVVGSMGYPDEFFAVKAGHVDKSVVGVGDHAFEVGFGDNRALGEGFFFLRDRKIYFHFFQYVKSVWLARHA